MDWDALLRLGLTNLGLDPVRFWRLTPYELQLMAGLDQRLMPMSRSRLADLERSFPDRTSKERSG